jgi:D-alanyl-D-alanine carboxypeptidase
MSRQRRFFGEKKRMHQGALILKVLSLAALFLVIVALSTFKLVNLDALFGVESLSTDASPEERVVLRSSDTPDSSGLNNSATATPPDTSQAPTVPDVNSWQLLLVNSTHQVPENFAPQLAPVESGYEVDIRCKPDLQQMLNDCRAAGFDPWICSAYRSQATQHNLYNNKVSDWTAQGYSLAKAQALAAQSVAIPGTSEHQLGLAVDIVDINYPALNDTQADRAVQQWLMGNSWRYGFILRYPADKTGVTGITFEPWHYRYVGKEAAAEIYERSICLEEYLK